MSKTKLADKKGFIVIQHSVLTEISDQECEEVIYQSFGNESTRLYFEHLKIRPVPDYISHKNMDEINWREAAAIQEDLVENKLKPLLTKFPNYEVVYFGVSPIPLAVHLGYLMEDWRRVNIFLRHHKEVENQRWYQNLDIENESIPSLVINGIPNDTYDIDDDVVVKVQVSYAINDAEIKKSITSDVAKTVNINLEKLQLDLSSVQQCHEITDRFEDALKAIVDNLPNIDTIHLIATIPVGLAFLLGRKIRSNINRPVQTYQYNKNADLPYNPVLAINQSYVEFSPLTDKEIKKAKSIRRLFQKNSWQNLQSLIRNHKEQALRNPDDNWLDLILGNSISKGDMGTSYWGNLQQLHKTALTEKQFNLKENIDGYEYSDVDESWGIGNRMIHDLNQRLPDTKDVERALRVVLIHEGLHYYQHNLSHITVEGIGRFPKIVEDADYQADIYAILYEYAYTKIYAPTDLDDNNLGRFFAKTLDIALAALWSFNDPGTTMKVIQVRRLNRFLIWYWQCVALSDSRVKTIKDVIKILAIKPVIEIKGLSLKAEGERVECHLERYVESNLEIGIFINNKIIRSGNTGYLMIPDLVKGFRDRNHQIIKSLLEGFYRGVMNH